MCLNSHTVFQFQPWLPTHADAQEGIRNFQATKNSNQITFSWDIVDGYHSSSDIGYFHIYYAYRPNTGYYSYIGYIYYTDSSLTVTGSSFQYTTTVTTFGDFGQYVMWVRVYRSSLSPVYSYSDQIYVEVGRSMPTCRKWTAVLAHPPCYLYFALTCNCFTVFFAFPNVRSRNCYRSDHTTFAISNMSCIHCE